MPSRSDAPIQSFSATVGRDGTGCFIPLPFDPKAVFGTVRAPVTVTVSGYAFRSRVVAMGGPACIGLRREHREAAGLSGGETVAVTVALDTAPRTVTLATAPRAARPRQDAPTGAADQATAGSPSTARSGGTHSARARTSRTTSKL